MSIFGSILGAVTGGLIGRSNAKSQASQNADLSRENWQYQQSNAHQLEVQDLRNAGLNPILSATQSQMAGMAPVSGYDAGNMGNNITSAVQGYFEREAKKEMQSKDLEIEQLRADIEKTRAETEKYRAEQEASLWKSQENLNSARVTNESQESVARVKEIENNIKNSISQTRALVEKFGAESSQARASAYNQLKQAAYAIELATGQRLSNQDFETFMKNPKRLLEKETFSRANDNPITRGLFMTAHYIKSLVGGVDSVSFGKSGFRFGSSSK